MPDEDDEYEEEVDPRYQMRTLEDAMRVCEAVVRDVRSGRITDWKKAEAVFKGVTTFCNAHIAQIRHSPKHIAMEEAARVAARRAAEAMTLDQAREILLSRNFTNLEEPLGIVVDVEAKVVQEEAKAVQIIKEAHQYERESTEIIRKRARTDIF